jgi:hypothetical protein
MTDQQKAITEAARETIARFGLASFRKLSWFPSARDQAMNISQEAEDAAEEIWLACCHVENEKPADPVSAYNRAFQPIIQAAIDAAHARGVAEERERAAGKVMDHLYPTNPQDDWTEYEAIKAGFAVSTAAAIREQDQ